MNKFMFAAAFVGISSAYMTFYGWPDNSPPGPDIAYPVIHKQAGGTGTYRDPITFASTTKEFPKGTRIYVPYLKRYLLMEDHCVDCAKDWSRGKAHVDVWAGGDSRHKRAVLACEDKLTPDGKVKIVPNPPKNLPVHTYPMFDIKTGRCAI